MHQTHARVPGSVSGKTETTVGRQKIENQFRSGCHGESQRPYRLSTAGSPTRIRPASHSSAVCQNQPNRLAVEAKITFNAEWEPDHPMLESNKLMTKQAQTGTGQTRRNNRTKFENVDLVGNQPAYFIKASDLNHHRIHRPNRYSQANVLSSRFV